MLNIDSHHYIYFTPESRQLKSGDIYYGEKWTKYEYKFYNMFQLEILRAKKSFEKKIFLTWLFVWYVGVFYIPSHCHCENKNLKRFTVFWELWLSEMQQTHLADVRLAHVSQPLWSNLMTSRQETSQGLGWIAQAGLGWAFLR